MEVKTKENKRLTFDEACKYYNKALSPKEGIKIIYIESAYQLCRLTIPNAKEIIGYFSGEENMYGFCVYYK